MPIFEYRCGRCGKTFEELVSSEKDIPKKCPGCGSQKIRKQLSTFSTRCSGQELKEPMSGEEQKNEIPEDLKGLEPDWSKCD